MSEQLKPLHVPLTCDDVIQSGWLRRTRNAILADGYEVRSSMNLTVEARVGGGAGEWRSIMLSNGGRHFLNDIELAKVMVYLRGELPIPDPTPEPT